MFAFFRRLWERIRSFFGRDDDGYGGGGFVTYYGCPNSKKAKKLVLTKRIFR